jgi:hypothetical protein
LKLIICHGGKSKLNAAKWIWILGMPTIALLFKAGERNVRMPLAFSPTNFVPGWAKAPKKIIHFLNPRTDVRGNKKTYPPKGNLFCHINLHFFILDLLVLIFSWKPPSPKGEHQY